MYLKLKNRFNGSERNPIDQHAHQSAHATSRNRTRDSVQHTNSRFAESRSRLRQNCQQTSELRAAKRDRTFAWERNRQRFTFVGPRGIFTDGRLSTWSHFARERQEELHNYGQHVY